MTADDADGSTFDPETAAHLRARDGPIVAWFAPFDRANDGLRVLEAFHVLTTFRRPDAFLVMAGPDHDPDHRLALQAMVAELTLERTWLAVNPSPGRLGAFSACADLALTPAVLAAADRAGGGRIGAVALGDALAELVG